MKPVKLATPTYLERVALHYMERHGGTEARVRRILSLRLSRSREAHGEPSREDGEQMLDALVAKLARLGYLDDARFARSRARALRQKGKSTRAIQSALMRLGVSSELAQDAIEGDDLEAARTFVRRRGLGGGEKDLAKLARAGFSYDVARRALEAE
ncbi:MAG: RecX family transcriptional regulator [Sandaracinaceae bacterium]|nr:RecX family transcriptional regulator [Sandaracinaceae bacterium]